MDIPAANDNFAPRDGWQEDEGVVRFQTWFLCQITTSPWRLTFCALWSSKCQITVPSLLVSSLHAFIYRKMFIYLERRAQLMPFLHLFVVVAAAATVSRRLCVAAVKSGFRFVWRLSKSPKLLPTLRGPQSYCGRLSIEDQRSPSMPLIFVRQSFEWRGTYHHIHIGSDDDDDDTATQSWEPTKSIRFWRPFECRVT